MDDYDRSRYQSPDVGASKRDSFAAQLDQDPSLSTARRALKSDLFSSRMATKSLERRVLAAETAKQELEYALKEKEIAMERLGNERRWLAERETEEREERTRLTAEWATERTELEATVRSLRTKFTTLQNTHADLDDEYSDLQRSSASTIASQKTSISTLERKVSLLEDELSRTRDMAQRHKDDTRTLRQQVEELELERDGMTRRGDDDSWTVVRDELNRQTAHWKSLESVNAKLTAEVHTLRAKQASVEVLREEKRSLERKLAQASDQEEQLVRLQAEVDAARREREDWAAFLANPNADPSSSTPTALTSAISTLRLDHAELLEQYGSLSSIIALRDAEIASLKETVADQAKSLLQLEEHLTTEEERVRRAERGMKLKEREVQGLEALLKTYEAEEAWVDVKEEDGEGTKWDRGRAQKIQLLERQVEDLKAVVRDLEAEREQADVDSKEPSGPSGDAAQQISDLEEELANAEDKISTLEQELYELGATINAGNHIPPATRIVQFTANPIKEDVDLKKETFERLKRENEALLHRLAEVEHGAGFGADDQLVPRESVENLWIEKNEMVKTVADKEKRLLRLKQVFTAKTEEFRQTVSNILGYTLFFQPTKIRLTSTYNLAAAITFQLNSSSSSNATMKLLGAGNGEDAGLTPRMNELIRYWIVERESVPCFMAALTLECFERTVGAEDGDTMQLTRTIG